MKRNAARRTQAERTAETRGRLLAAAMEILRLKGYTGFRVSEVSRLAKVSRGAQTHHFATKDDLVLAAVKEVFEQSAQASHARIEGLSDADDIVAELVKDGADFFLSPYFLTIVDLNFVGQPAGALRSAVVAIAREHRMSVERAWIDAFVARGTAKARAERALWVCFNVVRGMAVRRFIDDNAASRKRGLAELHDVVSGLLE